VSWLTLKAKLYTAAGFFLAFLAAVFRFKYVKGQRDKYKRHAETYEAQLHQKKQIEEVEQEINLDYADIEREAERDLDSGQMPDNIRDRNTF